MMKTNAILTAVALIAAPLAPAQVPAEIAAQLKEIGPGVCVQETGKIYKPLQPKEPYAGVTVVRNVPYGPDSRTVMDIFTPEKGGGNRPVLIFVPGGQGNKIEPGPNGDAFYDNVMLWAVKNRMIGVNMERRGGLNGGQLAWDEPAKDVGSVVEWVRRNISKYKGNPNRIFLWAHSAGNGPASTYVAHSEISGVNGEAIKGVILMSPPNINIAPEKAPALPPVGEGRGAIFGNCGRPQGEGRGGGPGDPGGRAGRGPGGRGGPGVESVDPETQLARSNLPGLAKGNIPVFLTWGELDPSFIIAFDTALKDALCKAGRCPATTSFRDHSHMSEVFSVNTADDSVSGPLLKWLKSVK